MAQIRSSYLEVAYLDESARREAMELLAKAIPDNAVANADDLRRTVRGQVQYWDPDLERDVMHVRVYFTEPGPEGAQ
jgi:hypothetical protein